MGTSYNAAWVATISVTQKVSELLLICGMTALGLSISVTDITKVGVRPLGAALLIAVATASSSLALTYTLYTVFSW